jgi:alcohol dehydrogenase YqhD (iron-dependent ADH family)
MEKSGGKLPEPTDPNPQVRRLAEAIAFVRNEKIRHMMKMTYEKEGGNA